MLDGVAELCRGSRSRRCSATARGSSCSHDPIGASGPPAPATAEPAWGSGEAQVEVVNEGEVPIGVTSHIHFFEANRALRFDRAAAWGMRLALAGRREGLLRARRAAPRAAAAPFGGRRVIRGHGGLCDGPLDAPGAREAALRAGA